MQTPELWTAQNIAELVRMSVRHVSERLVYQQGFPQPVIGGKKFGRKRWLKDDVIEWLTRK